MAFSGYDVRVFFVDCSIPYVSWWILSSHMQRLEVGLWGQVIHMWC